MFVIIIILVVILVAMFIFLIRYAYKVRKKYRKLIEQIEAFGQDINQEKVVFYCDNSSKKNLLDEKGISVPVLQKEFGATNCHCQIALCGLAPGSNIPTKSYRVAFVGCEFVYNDFGHPTGYIKLYFRPARCEEEWVITKVYDNFMTCYHRVMGSVTLKIYDENRYEPKQKITLRQYAYQIENDTFRINYEIC